MITKMPNLCGQTVTGERGGRYHLTEIKGQGAQGVVYAEQTGKYMVKLYYPSGRADRDRELIKKLRFVMEVEKPKNFVALYELITTPYIGYVMERLEGYTPLNAFLVPDPKVPFPDWYNSDRGFRKRLTIGYIIAKAFGEIADRNLSYCDISGNNIFVKLSKNGPIVKMIDIDNLYIAGRGNSAVLGTPRYIAPEIIRGDHTPDVLSDNYSLAVLLFELLRVGHPYISDDVLEGTPEDEERACSGEGEYVTESNSTNMLPEEAVFTKKLSELFARCFVDGKKNRLSRPSPRAFEFALMEASNKIILCSHCGAWHYARRDPSANKFLCPWCEEASKPRAWLNFYECLYAGNSVWDMSQRIIAKPKNSYILRDSDHNKVKNYYIVDIGGANDGLIESEDFLSFPRGKDGQFYIYNEFRKNGVWLLRKKIAKRMQILPGRYERLEYGDEIYFLDEAGDGTDLPVGDKRYMYARMARFVEDKQ